MAVVGIGIDIVEVKRVGEMVARHGDRFLSRIYSPREVAYCRSRKRQDEHFAAPPPEGGPRSLSEVQQLAVAGLVRLGYKEGDASRWVKEVSGDGEPVDVEEIIRAVFSQRSQELT